MSLPEQNGTARSRTAELNEGQTDGKYKKAVVNRGGFPETETAKNRVTLSPRNYDLEDTPAALMDLPGDSFDKQAPNYIGVRK